MLNSEKYSSNSTIVSELSETEKQEVLNLFADIELNSDFLKNFKERVSLYFQQNTDIDDEVKTKLLNTIANHSAIENSASFELIKAYNNIYEASFDYWDKKDKLKGVNSQDKAVVWGDAIGGAIGFGCGGFMSILMGAAVSHMVITCYEMDE